MKKKTKIDQIEKKDSRVARLIMFIIIIIAVGVMIGSISYTLNLMHENKMESKNVISYYIFNTSVEVTLGTVGLNGDIDSLKYGKITAGGGGTRFLDINSSEDAIVQVYLSGDMANYLSVEENNFFIEENGTSHLPVHLSIPNGTKLGIYRGQVHVILLKPDV